MRTTGYWLARARPPVAALSLTDSEPVIFDADEFMPRFLPKAPPSCVQPRRHERTGIGEDVDDVGLPVSGPVPRGGLGDRFAGIVHGDSIHGRENTGDQTKRQPFAQIERL